jgi:hypothetical protein
MQVRFARQVTGLAAAALSIALSAACGGRQGTSPAAPSSPLSAGAPAPVSSGATIAGTVVGASSASSVSTRGAGITVTVTGSSASSSVDAGGHFTLQNVPPGHVDLHFMGNGIDAHLPLDGVVDKQTLTITVRVSGSTAALEDDHSDAPKPGPSNPGTPSPAAPGSVELEGTVSAVTATSLVVAGRMVNVSASTVIVRDDRAIALSAITVGAAVEVRGTTTAAGGPIAATKIELEDRAPNPPDDNEDNKNDGTTMVRTNAATEFKDTTCAALKVGDSVEVKGSRQTDSSVLAARVERKD